MGSWTSILIAILTALIGLSACTVALTGYLARELRFFERVLVLAAGLGLIHKSHLTDLLAISIFAGLLLLNFVNKRRAASPAEAL
jgi:TRAP-type uncharacterized transport system fused permease subunit